MSTGNANLTVGDAVYIGGAILGLDNTSMTVGACGLWSDGILVQGTDSHGIVDIDSMKIINDNPKHITLKRRVWIGRRATIMKNLTIEEGSIVATGALVAKDVPKACIVAGVPAKVVRERVSWTHRQSYISEFDQREILKLRNELDNV
jgi:acetyltransferase-like isoleucine patch superfamily enzyme